MGSTAGHRHIKLKDFVSWFEIPAYDIHRAAQFYGTLYGMQLEIAQNGDFAMAYFPAAQGVGGALIAGPGCVPCDTGTLIYLNAGNDLDGILGRVDLAGGRVIMTKALISETAGWFALFIDSEGNRVALHEGPSKVTRSRSTTKAPAKAPAKVAAKRGSARKATPAGRKKKEG